MQHKMDVKVALPVSILEMMDLVFNVQLVLSVPLQELQYVANVDVVDNQSLIELTVNYVLLVNSLLNLEHVKLVNKTNIHQMMVLVYAVLVVLV